MKNPGHFNTALAKTNKKPTMSTERGASLIEMAIKVAFYVDTTRLFINDSATKAGERLVRRLNDGLPLDFDSEYAVALSLILHSSDIFHTAVYLGLDTLVIVNSIAFCSNQSKTNTNYGIDIPGNIKAKKTDKFGNVEKRWYDMRKEDSYDDEIGAFAGSVASILERRLTKMGRDLVINLDIGIGDLHQTFVNSKVYLGSLPGADEKHKQATPPTGVLDTCQEGGKVAAEAADKTQQPPGVGLEPLPLMAAARAPEADSGKEEDPFVLTRGLRTLHLYAKKAIDAWEHQVQALVAEIKHYDNDDIDGENASALVEDIELFPWDAPKITEKGMYDAVMHSDEEEFDENEYEEESEEAGSSFRASTIETKEQEDDEDEDDYDDDEVEYLPDVRIKSEKKVVIVDLMDSPPSSDSSATMGKSKTDSQIILSTTLTLLFTDEKPKAAGKRAADSTPIAKSKKSRH